MADSVGPAGMAKASFSLALPARRHALRGQDTHPHVVPRLLRLARVVGPLSVMAMLGGCATAPPAAERAASTPASDFRAIAIVVAGSTAKTELAGIRRVDPQEYANAGAQGLGMGALSGVAAGSLLPFALAAGPAGIAAIPFIFAGAAAMGFVGGYAHGASAIGPSPQAKALESTMTSATNLAGLPNATAVAIAADIARWTPHRAEVFPVRDVRVDPATRRYGLGASEDFDGVLQVEITQIGYAARRAGKDVALYMIAEARLLDARNGQPVALRGLAYVSPWHETDLWTRDDGALTRTELERASRTLAGRIVEHMFLHAPWRAPPVDRATANVCGIVPIAAPGAASRAVADAQAPVKVDGVNPLLGWSVPAAAMPDTEGAVAAAADDLRFDLRIFEEFDWGPGELVYERSGLRGNEHRVEAGLKPATMYFWTLRARFTVAGHPHATRWSATLDTALLDPLPSQVVYGSSFASGALARVDCAVPQDFTPCGCLDFIPSANWFRFRTP